MVSPRNTTTWGSTTLGTTQARTDPASTSRRTGSDGVAGLEVDSLACSRLGDLVRRSDGAAVRVDQGHHPSFVAEGVPEGSGLAAELDGAMSVDQMRSKRLEDRHVVIGERLDVIGGESDHQALWGGERHRHLMGDGQEIEHLEVETRSVELFHVGDVFPPKHACVPRLLEVTDQGILERVLGEHLHGGVEHLVTRVGVDHHGDPVPIGVDLAVGGICRRDQLMETAKGRRHHRVEILGLANRLDQVENGGRIAGLDSHPAGQLTGLYAL